MKKNMRINIHTFMTLGPGPIWRKEEVEVLETHYVSDITLHGHQHKESDFVVFEEFTGGVMGKGETLSLAFADAAYNIGITPDIKDQIKEMGFVEELNPA